MPPKIPIPKVPAFARPIQQRASCQRPCIKTPRCPPSSQARCLSTYSPKYEDMEVDQGERPRWQTTPHNMAAPIRSRPKPRTSEFKVNDDPRRLDQMYIQLLGNGGDKMLTEEVKWLAVTHKSFDHGRRGFNDRLTFMGMPMCPRERRDGNG